MSSSSITLAPRHVVLALSSMLAAGSAEAGMRVCTRPDVELPAHVRDAVALEDGTDESTYGWSGRVLRLRDNRRALETGRLSAAAAQARGGTVFFGALEVPVFLVRFANTPDSQAYPSSDLQNQLFGSNPTGTVSQYYEEVSYGNISVSGTVYDWFDLSQDDTYYEGGMYFGDPCNGSCSAGKVGELITETLDFHDATIDFGLYDNDGPDGIPNSGDDDGKVDFVAFVHPEKGAECVNDPSAEMNIWSHKWNISGWTGSSYTTNDTDPNGNPIRINDYTIQPAQSCDGDIIEIGVFCHEFGHAFGLKDLYDTNKNNGDSNGIGYWGIMGSGSWNTPDRPAHMSAFYREWLGWLSYFNVTHDIWLTLPEIELFPFAVRIWKDGDPNSPEYFVVENRQRIGFDENLPGTGFVIYHVDENVHDANYSSNTVNANEAQKAVDVECADGYVAGHPTNADHLDDMTNRGDAGDRWCPLTQPDFDQFSVPDSRSYSGVQTGVAVRDIQQCEGRIRANFIVGQAQQGNLCMVDCEFDDQCQEITYPGTCNWWWTSPDIWVENDDDGLQDLPAWGMDNRLWFRIHNAFADDVSDVSVKLYYGDPAMGQLWPSTGTQIGETVHIPILEAWHPYEDYVKWHYPVPRAGIDHYCIGAVVESPQDPQNSEFAPNDNNVAQINHQVLVVRAGEEIPRLPQTAGAHDGTGALQSSTDCGPFEKKSRIFLYDGFNPMGGQRTGIVQIGADADIPATWNLDIEPGVGPFQLSPGEPDSICVVMKAANASHGETAHVPLTLWDPGMNRPIGGVMMDYVIDCLDPIAPDYLQVTCLPAALDDLDAPNVRLDWNHVTEDELGGMETVLYYEVHRTDNGGGTALFTVAIDQNTDEEGMQWYDTVPRSAEFTYTYRVRAIDWAQAPGPWSPGAQATCSATVSTGEPASVPGTRLGAARPNPLNATTAITFEISTSGEIALMVFNAQGERVRSLAAGAHDAGLHRVTWDGRSESGARVPSGVYFYQLETSGFREARKLVVTR